MASKRILVTRPRHQTEQFALALEEAGYPTDCIHLLDIEPLPLDAVVLNRLGQTLDHADAIIVISPNAARLAWQAMDNAELSIAGDCRLFAIGPGTAAIIEQKGLAVELPRQGYHSEGLLQLDYFQKHRPDRVALFAGVGGRDILEQGLAHLNISCQRFEFYKRQPRANADEALMHLSEPAAMSAMSVDTLNALHRALNLAGLRDPRFQSWPHLPLLVPSGRVAKSATEMGFSKVINVEKPTAQAFTDAMAALV